MDRPQMFHEPTENIRKAKYPYVFIECEFFPTSLIEFSELSKTQQSLTSGLEWSNLKTRMSSLKCVGRSELVA